MWDRLITDCHVATMVPQPGNPLGLFPNAAIGIDGGRIVRVGKRTELAGFRAKEVVALGGLPAALSGIQRGTALMS